MWLIRKVMSGAVVYTDRLRKFKVLRGLGSEPGDTRPKRTEAMQSGLGLQSIMVGFQTLSDYYNVPYGFFDVTPDVGGSMAYFMLGETAANSAGALAFETRSLAEIAAEDGEAAQGLRELGELALKHEDYLKVILPASIGITTGFSAADGD